MLLYIPARKLAINLSESQQRTRQMKHPNTGQNKIYRKSKYNHSKKKTKKKIIIIDKT